MATRPVTLEEARLAQLRRLARHLLQSNPTKAQLLHFLDEVAFDLPDPALPSEIQPKPEAKIFRFPGC